MRTNTPLTILACLALFTTACRTTQSQRWSGDDPVVQRGLDPVRAVTGDEIVVCGRRFSTGGAPVVLWTDRGAYNAYNTRNHFHYTKALAGPRYTPGRERSEVDGSTVRLVGGQVNDPAELAAVVDQFVLHYDACGTSQACFRVLHDERKLSVHFLLDVDGTIYQTMDVRDQAWHASSANPRSVGVEIAHVGAYPAGDAGKLSEWYATDPLGPYVRTEKIEDRGVRTIGFVPRPAREQRIVGEIHGRTYEQYDFTREQYESLAKLTAALARALPGLRLDAPRGADGAVRRDALSDEELAGFQGVLGHYHVTTNKQDPGPAFDWESYLRAARSAQVAN